MLGPVASPGTRRVTYLREDSTARKVYTPDGRVFLEFGRAVGDTLDVGDGTNNLTIDSVTFETIQGVSRRVQWATRKPVAYTVYYNVEGVGAGFYALPAPGGDWYTLRCFSRGGQLQYTADPARPCFRNPPLGLPEASPAAPAYSLTREGLALQSPSALPVRLEVFDLTGRLLCRSLLTSAGPHPLPDAPACIIRLTGRTGSTAFRVPAVGF